MRLTTLRTGLKQTRFAPAGTVWRRRAIAVFASGCVGIFLSATLCAAPAAGSPSPAPEAAPAPRRDGSCHDDA